MHQKQPPANMAVSLPALADTTWNVCDSSKAMPIIVSKRSKIAMTLTSLAVIGRKHSGLLRSHSSIKREIVVENVARNRLDLLWIQEI